VADYHDAFPELRNDAERVLGLIYEEFCLREEAGEAPDPKEFYARYEPWRDSLASQLNYHQMLSQDAGVGPGAAPRFPEPGMHFLGFRLRAVLGQGGEARVFLADDENLGGRVIALRVSPDRGEEPSIMGRLDHPHIMPVLTVVRDPETGLRGHGMPYCPGRPLDEVLPRMESIPPETRTARTLLDADAPGDLAARCDGPGWAGFPRRSSYADACTWLAARLAEALGHAHERGILHLDVEPTNVLLSADGGPMLLGFNLAHDPHAPERAENALRGGTLPYMAPEQLEAFRDPERRDRVGPTADLYALGLVLRELLTGRRPEAPPANLPLTRVINDLLAQRLNGWPPIRVDNPQVPHALGAIVGRCLALDPADRYPDALALAEDLRGFLRRRPLVHARNPNRPERIGNWFRRNRLSLAVAASLLVGLASAAATVRDGHDSFAHLGSIISRALACDPTPPRADLSLRLVTNAEEDPPPHDAPIAPAITTYAMASRQSEAEHPMPRPLGGDR
jgi:serine/threonine protein kinase